MFLNASHKLRTLVFSLALAFAVPAYAAPEQPADQSSFSSDSAQPKKRRRIPLDEMERARREAVSERASRIFSLLSAEMILSEGQGYPALQVYADTLKKTRSPEVAERAVEIALSLNQIRQAQNFYASWKAFEPEADNAQKRTQWLLALLPESRIETSGNLKNLLDKADEEDIKRTFLLAAQMIFRQPKPSENTAAQIHQAAKQYPDLAEAAVADAVYSAETGNSKNVQAALQRLAAEKAQNLHPTHSTLRFLTLRHPETLAAFFDTHNASLPPAWAKAETVVLLKLGRVEQAYERRLARFQEPAVSEDYLEAAILAERLQKDEPTITHYLQKAFETGSGEQKSQVAAMAAIRAIDQRSYTEAAQWAGKIDSPAYRYDRLLIQANLEVAQKQFAQALKTIRLAKQSADKQGRFFGESDEQRIYLYTLSMQLPQQALAELNTLAAKTKKQGNEQQLAEIYYQRGLVHERLGRYAAAIADLRAYYAANPDSASAMNALGYTLLSQPQLQNTPDEAFTLIQTAYNLSPQSEEINDSLGWAYYLKGDTAAALPYLQYAYRHYQDAEIAAHLGEVLWQSGEQEQAKQVWQQGLKLQGNTELLKNTMKKFGVLPINTEPKRKTGKR
ncbi:tetratricopeptide repeat protein [Neisseria lisongii]|uniref:Tetratricopeptide repeat protein n=1 Tax=Neisseria lisongii TaxID=2912188 RepID=A0AAW5AQA4_9NEIS|nr:tetratricopeptide repeat protein [Neisseria lisongii]MCF7528725.1 tetratricopeptide repeat protein [Neisseria lisongii]MCF7529583.1 tetratricopeptide repeat protein [Neisseria lisongii]